MAALELFEHLYPTMGWKQEEMKNLIFRYIRHFGTFQTEVKTNYHRDTAHKTDWFYQDIWSPYNQSLQMDIALEGFSSLSLMLVLLSFLRQWYYSCHIGHFHQLHDTHTEHMVVTYVAPQETRAKGLDSADGFLRCVCSGMQLSALRLKYIFIRNFLPSFFFIGEIIYIRKSDSVTSEPMARLFNLNGNILMHSSSPYGRLIFFCNGKLLHFHLMSSFTKHSWPKKKKK